MNERARLPDYLKGIAVYLMIIFHTAYDLDFFGYYNMNYPDNVYWYGLPRLIVFLFLICVGMGLFLAHSQMLKVKKFLKRLGVLLLCASVISVVTYFIFPQTWIYFGTLHCIALCSILTLLFVRIPLIAGLLGLALLVTHFALGIHIPWFELPHASLDYIPLFPWWGFPLIGVFLASRGVCRLKLPSCSFLELPGRHSLMIYLLHQPLIFGTIYLFYRLTQ